MRFELDMDVLSIDYNHLFNFHGECPQVFMDSGIMILATSFFFEIFRIFLSLFPIVKMIYISLQV